MILDLPPQTTVVATSRRTERGDVAKFKYGSRSS
jgi:hypothetical protein